VVTTVSGGEVVGGSNGEVLGLNRTYDENSTLDDAADDAGSNPYVGGPQLIFSDARTETPLYQVCNRCILRHDLDHRPSFGIHRMLP